MPTFLNIVLLLAWVCLPAQAEHARAETNFEDRLPTSALETLRRGRGAEESATSSGGDAKGADAKGASEKDEQKTEEQKAEEKLKADAQKIADLKKKEGTPTENDVKDLNKLIEELSKAPKDAFSEQRLAQINELIEERSRLFNLQNRADLAPVPPAGPSTPAAQPTSAVPSQIAATVPIQTQATNILLITPPPPPTPPAPVAAPTAAAPPANVVVQSQTFRSTPPTPLAPITRSAPTPFGGTASNSSSTPGPVASAPETLPIFRSSTTSGTSTSPVFASALPAAPPPAPAPPPPAPPAGRIETGLPVIVSAAPPPPAPEPMQPSAAALVVQTLPSSAAAPVTQIPPAPPAFPTASLAVDRASPSLPSNAPPSVTSLPSKSQGYEPANPVAAETKEPEYERTERAVRAEPVIAPEPEIALPGNSRPAARELASVVGGYKPPSDLDLDSAPTASPVFLVDTALAEATPLPPLTISASPTKSSEIASALKLTGLQSVGDTITEVEKEKEKKIEDKLTDLTSFLRANLPRR